MKQHDTPLPAAPNQHKSELMIGIVIAVVGLAIAALVVLIIRDNMPKIVYQPVAACDLFNLSEAKELLGSGTVMTNQQNPVVKSSTATSNCGYTDGNADMDAVIVAAVIIRSGINDKGVAQNRAEFDAGKPNTGVEALADLGDRAYFNQARGQLNILRGHEWIIISNGIAPAPETNSLDDAVAVAHKILQ